MKKEVAQVGIEPAHYASGYKYIRIAFVPI